MAAFNHSSSKEWLKLYKLALENEIDSTAIEIVLKINRLREINEELKSIIDENEKVLRPHRRRELRSAAEWLKGI